MIRAYDLMDELKKQPGTNGVKKAVMFLLKSGIVTDKDMSQYKRGKNGPILVKFNPETFKIRAKQDKIAIKKKYNATTTETSTTSTTSTLPQGIIQEPFNTHLVY